MSELKKDPMILFRNTIRGKNSKGGDRTQLYLGGDKEAGNAQIQALIDVLLAGLSNERGVKLDFHTSQKVAQGGRSFESTICFVKPVGEVSTQGHPTTRFVPGAATSAQIDKMEKETA